MRYINIHVSDAPLTLKDGIEFTDLFINGYGSTYGRFIFTQPIVGVHLSGDDEVTFTNCTFNNLDTAILVTETNLRFKGTIVTDAPIHIGDNSFVTGV